jgi:hypothetical protein
MSTPSYIARMNKDRSDLFVYGNKYGFETGSMTPGRTMLKTKDGHIIKGTVNGFYYFNPDELNFTEEPSKIFISDFTINSHPVLPGKDSPLTQPMEEISEVTLTFDQNNFAFNFGTDITKTIAYGTKQRGMTRRGGSALREERVLFL